MQCPSCGHRRAKDKPCLFCRRECQVRRAHGPQGCALLRYRKMKHRAAERGWSAPDFSKEDFLSWSLMDAQFLRLHEGWVRSGYRKWETPSLDRINPALSYLRGNLRWVTWRENWEKGCYQDHKLPPMDGERESELPY